MFEVKNEENVLIVGVKNATSIGKKIYILGAALGAGRIAEGLKYKGLDFEAFVVDKEYYTEGRVMMGKSVLCIDEIDPSNSVIIRSIANYPKVEELNSKFETIDEDVLSLSMVASEPMDIEYIIKNKEEFENLYNKLADDKSRMVMKAYLNQKITGKFSEMADVWDEIQYFNEEFYDITKVRCIVDCGAYIGDSYMSFADEYKKASGKEFEGKAFLVDPDEHNQREIKKNTEGSKAEIYALQIGVSDKKDTLYFATDDNYGNAGRIADSGDLKIEVDSIDNFSEGHKVDLIKMDIEGIELAALKGGAETIIRDHPVLTICAYHKREDLLELSNYILSLYSGYKFYIRAYGGPYSIELVLFAVA